MEIEKKHSVYEEYLPLDEANKIYNLKNLPDENEQNVRIIHIGDYDSCPCIGEHVKNTAEIQGKFKIISTSFSENILRIRFKLVNPSKIH